MNKDRGYIRGHVERDGARNDGPIRFVAATEGVKADGIDLRMTGVELDRFRNNPVVLFGHDARGRQNLPIGRADNIDTHGDSLKMDISFDRDDEFAITVERKIRNGFLNSVSIGFDVHGWEKPSQSLWNGGVATKWELFETSVVPVPMDDKANVESGRSLFTDDLLAKSSREVIRDWVRSHMDEYLEEWQALNLDKRASGLNSVDAAKVLASFSFEGKN